MSDNVISRNVLRNSTTAPRSSAVCRTVKAGTPECMWLSPHAFRVIPEGTPIEKIFEGVEYRPGS